MIISGGKVFGGAGFDARDVYVEGGAFAEEPIGECSPGQTIDASNCWVIPGLIDVHFHGAVGHDFCDADDEGIAAIARYEASQGVTAPIPNDDDASRGAFDSHRVIDCRAFWRRR